MGVRSGVRPGPDPAGWGPPVPASQQPETPVHQPEGDQPETSDVTGKMLEVVRLRCGCTFNSIISALKTSSDAFVVMFMDKADLMINTWTIL